MGQSVSLSLECICNAAARPGESVGVSLLAGRFLSDPGGAGDSPQVTHTETLLPFGLPSMLDWTRSDLGLSPLKSRGAPPPSSGVVQIADRARHGSGGSAASSLSSACSSGKSSPPAQQPQLPHHLPQPLHHLEQLQHQARMVLFPGESMATALSANGSSGAAMPTTPGGGGGFQPLGAPLGGTHPLRMERAVSCEPSLMGGLASAASLKGVNPNRYKTELCRPFEENGYCKYSDKCQFAHGHQELRCMSRHPKYKTELCRTFHTTGFCPYGPRCHFIHNEDERKLGQLNQIRHQQAIHQVAQQHQQVIHQVAQHQHQQHQQRLLSRMSASPTPTPTPTPRMMTPSQSPSRQHQFFQPLQVSPLSSPGQPQSAPAMTTSPVFQFQQQTTSGLRPKALDFSSSSHTLQSQMALGSLADTPPSSVTDSPTPSPNSFCDDIGSPPPGFTSLPASHVSAIPAVFALAVRDFTVEPRHKENLCIASEDYRKRRSSDVAPVAMNSDDDVTDARELLKGIFKAPPTPPLSADVTGSDVNPCARLPIFSQLATGPNNLRH